MKKSKFLIGALACLGTLLVSCGQSKPSISETPTTGEPTSTPTTVVTTPKPVEYYNEVYQNPVAVTYSTGSDYKSSVADPSIVKGDDGNLYIFATGGVVLKSEDGCNFEVVTTKIIGVPDWWQDVYPKDSAAGFGIWAPDVIKIGDTWIYYYSLSAWGKCCGVGYATSDNIAGPYEDQGKLFDLNEIGIQNCIDPQVIVDDDGSVYMAVGSFQGLYLLELTDDGMGLYNGVQYQYDNKVLIAGRPGSWDGSTYEGSYIIKEGEYYYFFGSAGTCCESGNSTYRVYVGRSKNIAGPYVDAGGRSLTASGSGKTYGELVVWAGTSSDKKVAGPGHNSIFKDDKGDLWIYYHSYCETDNYRERVLFMDKLSWDDKGFPYVSYIDPDTEKEIKYKPSYGIELNGPSFIY